MNAEIAALRELLDPLGVIRFRRMFGGMGIYAGELMFGLVIDEVLYFKTDATTQPDYSAEGCGPFIYARKDGRQVSISYWRVPERLLDEPEELLSWGRAAHGVAIRHQKTKITRGAPARPRRTR
jgi:DNA transformation protein